MINKKIAFFISLIVFLLSTYTSYSFFMGGSEKVLSPFVPYQPPKTNGNNMAEGVVPSEPKTEECPLNGEMLTKTQKSRWEGRRPLGVTIENHKDARPQSGLPAADVIYEAVAEGGISRFLAIYYCQDASYVGPVRSARIYFIKILEGYGDYPLYAHVGGANTPGPADALGYIKTIGWSLYNDLNQFAVPFPYFWRDYERLPGRVTEHTVYSSTTRLWQFAKEKRELSNVDEKGKPWNKNFTPWKFKDDAAASERGTVAKIDFGFWTTFASQYSVVWSYAKQRNTYLRTNGGEPHLDKNTGKQLEAKNIVIVFARESAANDGYEGGHIVYKLTGTGDALVFQDGRVISASWGRSEEGDLMKFYDENNREISMVRGQVFVEILPIGNKVIY
jgi:hypothetical protein